VQALELHTAEKCNIQYTYVETYSELNRVCRGRTLIELQYLD